MNLLFGQHLTFPEKNCIQLDLYWKMPKLQSGKLMQDDIVPTLKK
ncbi:hypothetical protein HMPREF3213_01810 [Heyndrickxia coagulans]|uniref:Uncharacterized protein n=1 Tax=Heyndrickxia coagulans TaxID=1398 RepID=A0A133KRS7_HEYCO|nr:hypothetical protein HMPREF3213_01810 [Heyndrickxia coagulans]